MGKTFDLVAPLIEKYSSKQGKSHCYFPNRIVLNYKDGREYVFLRASLDF